MKFILFLALFNILSLTFCNHASAADPDDVAKVVKLIHSKKTKGVLLRKFDKTGGVEIVFVSNGLRYTMYHSGSKDINFLSVWVRPNGTTSKAKLKTFTDQDLNGKVDFGLKLKDGSDLTKKLYYSSRSGQPQKGQQFSSYWQKIYDTSIDHALQKLTTK